MKKLFILLLSIGIITTAAAQNNNNNKVNIEALKIAYITKQLNLTAEEAQSFWPLHNSYVNELKAARKDNLNDELEFEEKALNIRKKYYTEFKKVLNSDERVNNIFKAEKSFNNMMRKELMNRSMNNNPALKKRVEAYRKQQNY